MTTRWGIASAGLISNDFVTAVNLLPQEEHKVVAVAARSKKSAEEFAAKHRIPAAYEGYAALAKDPNVEVVYVGGINPTHLEVAKLMLEGGKHVLCEKPLCMNVRETQELVSFARSKNLFLMEGIWSRFTPAYQTIRKLLDEKKIGDVKQVNAMFGRKIEAARMHEKALGGGTVLDLGIYTIQIASMAFGHQKPEKIISGGKLGREGCDSSTSSTVLYSNGTATLVTHSEVDLSCEAEIVGTEGSITLSFPFWSPTRITVTMNGNPDKPEVLEFPLLEPLPGSVASDPSYQVNFNYFNSANFAHEAKHVRECLVAGKTESPIITLDETLIIAEIMQSIRTQVGVVYPQD